MKYVGEALLILAGLVCCIWPFFRKIGLSRHELERRQLLHEAMRSELKERQDDEANH